MPWTVDGLEFDYRKSITPTRPGAALTDYPLKVGVVADADIGGRCLATGNDLRFTRQSDDALLSAEKNNFSVTGGAATGNFWVRLPSLSSIVDAPLWCYYGNAGASAQANPTGVWTGYAAGYHCNESSGNLLDFTGNGKTLTAVGSPTYGVAGRIGTAVLLPGDTNTYFWRNDGLVTGGVFSNAIWVNPASNATMHWVDITQSGTWHNRWNITTSAGTPYAAVVAWPAYQDMSGGTVTPGQWLHIVNVRVSASERYLYVNGQPVDSGTTAISPSGIDRTYLGIDEEGGFYYPANGLVGAWHIDAAAWSAERVAYDYLTQNTAAGGLTWGAEEVAVTGGVVLPYSRLLSLGLRG